MLASSPTEDTRSKAFDIHSIAWILESWSCGYKHVTSTKAHRHL